MTPGPKPTRPGAPVDELRQRLRQLGYLDAGVDRFVLGSAHASQGAGAVALLASLRIGLLGALLLGPAAALGVAVRLPGLVTGGRDILVLALYTAALFGVAIALVALAASLLVNLAARRAGAALASRARPLSIAAGVAIGASSLTYLAMLWTSVSVVWGPSSAGGAGWPWLLAGFAVVAGISLLLGHAVTLTALAVIVAGTRTDLPRRGVPGSSWRVLIGSAALAFCGALMVFLMLSSRREATAPLPPLTVVPSGLRVRVVAIDGIDPATIDRLARAGQATALVGALTGAADVSFDDRPGHPYDPARVWTTVATGQPSSVHGIETLETTRVAGVGGRVSDSAGTWRSVRTALDLVRLTRPAIASGTERLSRTFWEVAAGAGLRTAVVNWWATWPAPPDAGVVLSDRATLRLERGGALDAEIAPGSLYDSLEKTWPAIRDEGHRLAAAALAGAPDDDTLLPQAARLDAVTRLLTARVTGQSMDLTASYYAGPDVVRSSVSAGGAATALDAYYLAFDRMVAPVLTVGDREILIVIAAPGRAGGSLGRLAVRGPAARATSGDTLRPTDIAPTILYALGLPISRELPGRPATSLFASAFAARYPTRFVASYGRPDATRAVRSGQPLEQEMVDRLRSLGYVK